LSALARRRPPEPRAWRRSGQSLVREFAFRDFDQAIAFVQQLGNVAEDHLRRPNMCIVDFNHVLLTITNPRHAGITPAELRLAAKVDAFVDGCEQS
jgi:4a-hydroxytetrahydrobiopterin dehydratase